ncbi:MAG: copper resistance protein CopC [Sphingomonadales bacterium]|nr:copper resistance protein CopC [Sphingomonadales bacterium]
MALKFGLETSPFRSILSVKGKTYANSLDLQSINLEPFLIRFLFLAAIVAIATPASAHLKLTASTPAANAKVAKPGRIILTFSDKMVASSFKAELVMITMPGMADHPPMKMSGYTTQMSGDGQRSVRIWWFDSPRFRRAKAL